MLTLWYNFIPCQGMGNYANHYDITLYLAREMVTMLTLWYNFIPCHVGSKKVTTHNIMIELYTLPGKGNYANIMISLYTLPGKR